MTRVQHGKPQPASGKPNARNVRSEIAALSRRVVAEHQEALEILAAHDRGETPTTSDQQPPAGGQPNVRPEIAALSRRVVAEDREVLEILAAYDRGEAPRQSTSGRGTRGGR